MKEKYSLVITTISGSDTPILKKIADGCTTHNWNLIIAGDRKSPADFHLAGANYLSIDDQNNLEHSLAGHLPENHYCRKNIGYLEAMKQGAQLIVDTDDDNIPESAFWRRHCNIPARKISGRGWYNVFENFYNTLCWPRGYPLEKILHSDGLTSVDTLTIPEETIGVEQGMVGNEPDLDAIFRLTRSDRPVPKDAPNVILGENVWCPFNSQNTKWHSAAFPLLYLPATCSFRMTDIWRSFIAQRGLWLISKHVLFHQFSATQIRNQHNFKHDFLSEIPGYQNNIKIAETLESIQPDDNNLYNYLQEAYRLLVEEGMFAPEELNMVDAWINDVKNILHE